MEEVTAVGMVTLMVRAQGSVPVTERVRASDLGMELVLVTDLALEMVLDQEMGSGLDMATEKAPDMAPGTVTDLVQEMGLALDTETVSVMA